MQASVELQISERGIARVTLNRPEKHNAFDDKVIDDLRQHFFQLAQREDVRAVILQSTGKSFSAGADLGWMQRMASYSYEQNLEDARGLADMLQALYALPQPTIARVQGAAYGGAVGLISCCDLAVASTNASFCLSEVRIGLIPATIGPYVARAIGERACRRYFLSAERFDPDEALRLGLVSEVCAEDSLDDKVDSLADEFLNNGPQAVRAAKSLLNSICGKPLSPELIEYTCNQIAQIRVSDEGQAGLNAFLNKQAPSWREA